MNQSVNRIFNESANIEICENIFNNNRKNELHGIFAIVC